MFRLIILLLSQNTWRKEDIQKVNDLCDRYYKNSPVSFDDVLNSDSYSIFLINIDKGFAKELDPQWYVDLIANLLRQSEIDY